MEFNEVLEKFTERIELLKATVSTEEATKMSLVVPFFQLLGYDVFNPAEFCPEFTADVGIKKGEKVDYAIILDNEPSILIECKSCTEALTKHSSQLFRYFGTSPAKFGILTNGIIYQFFTDLEESNKMDLKPFLEVNLESLNDGVINQLKRFQKENFDKNSIFSTASELKYSNLIKEFLDSEVNNPDDEFVRFILGNVYDGQKTQKIVDKFMPIVKRSFNSYISEMLNKKLTSALQTNSVPVEEEPQEEESKVVTTEREIESFYIIRGMLGEVVPVEHIVYRDTESYFGILFDDNNRKPICRINLDTKKPQILIPDEKKNFQRFYISSLNDLYNYKDELLKAVKLYM